MNFGEWTSALKDSAAKAADAARSFKGFDDMAEKDDYIHSDDLNVKKRETVVSKVVEMATTNKRKSEGLGVQRGESYLVQKGKEATKAAPVPLLSVVKSALQSENIAEPKTEQDNASVKDTEEEEKRPKRKQATRFLDDLEERTSKENDPTSEESTKTEPRPEAKNTWFGWKPGKVDSRSSPKGPLWVRTKPQKDTPVVPDEEQYAISQSTALLDSDDLNELTQIRDNSGRFRLDQLLPWLMEDYPRECLVGLALFLAALMFYYLRGRSAQDSVV